MGSADADPAPTAAAVKECAAQSPMLGTSTLHVCGALPSSSAASVQSEALCRRVSQRLRLCVCIRLSSCDRRYIDSSYSCRAQHSTDTRRLSASNENHALTRALAQVASKSEVTAWGQRQLQLSSRGAVVHNSTANQWLAPGFPGTGSGIYSY